VAHQTAKGIEMDKIVRIKGPDGRVYDVSNDEIHIVDCQPRHKNSNDSVSPAACAFPADSTMTVEISSAQLIFPHISETEILSAESASAQIVWAGFSPVSASAQIISV
jgi:hypothetical protein